MKKNNPWMVATIFLALIALSLIIINLQQERSMFEIEDLSIPEEDMAKYLDVFGDKPFQLCELDTNKCWYLKKGE